MAVGRRFKLNIPTVATELTDGQRVAVTIPSGAVVQVSLVQSDGSPMVEVWCEGRRLSMFGIDLAERGQEVLDDSQSSAESDIDPGSSSNFES